MRIYKVNVEHKEEGRNWSGFKVAADSFSEALIKATKRLEKNEVIEDIRLLEAAD